MAISAVAIERLHSFIHQFTTWLRW